MNPRYYSITQIARANLALILICLLGLCLRFPGISADLPYFYHEDEAHHFNRTVNMVKSGDLDPRYFHKPSLHFYLRIPVVAASFLWNVKQGHVRKLSEVRTKDEFGVGRYAFTASHPGMVKWNRAFSVALGIISIILTYLITLRLINNQVAGYLAGLLVAVAPALVARDPIIGVDVVMTTACLAAVYASLRLFDHFSLGALFVAGILAGLAVSSKYNALPIALVPLVFCIVDARINFKTVLIAFCAPLAGFLAGSPYILSSLPLFLDQFAYEIWHYGIAGHAGHTGSPGIEQALFYSNWLVSDAIGYLVLLAAPLGVILLAIGNRAKALTFLCFPALFFLLMIAQRANFTRNMLVIIPFLAVLAAFATHYGVELLDIARRHKSLAHVGLAFALLLQPTIQSGAAYSGSLRRGLESRDRAAEWLSSNPHTEADTAIAGELQFAPQVYEQVGVSKFDDHQYALADLYQMGFERAVVGPALKVTAEEQAAFPVEKEFFGEKTAQRVVVDPHIVVYNLAVDLRPADALRLTSQHRARYAEISATAIGSTDSDERTCYLGSDEISSETYCWTRVRDSTVVFSEPGLVSGSNSVYELEVMSPWDQQRIEFSAHEWKQVVELSSDRVGEWQMIELSIPQAILPLKQLHVRTYKLRAPDILGPSSDKRRLGVALRYSATRQ